MAVVSRNFFCFFDIVLIGLKAGLYLQIGINFE